MSTKLKFISVAVLAVIAVLALASVTQSQWKWGYLTQAYFLKKNDGKALEVPANHSGTWKVWHENGNPSAREEYQNGKLNGASLSYYPSGQLKAKYHWKDNRLNGQVTRYYDTSTEDVEFKRQYQGGQLHGLCEYFSSTGILKRIDVYQQGKIMQQVLKVDGQDKIVYDRSKNIGHEDHVIEWGVNE